MFDFKSMLQNNSLTMQQKYLTFMMFADPQHIPLNPAADHYDLGETIKGMIEDGVIKFNGFDDNFVLHIEISWTLI